MPTGVQYSGKAYTEEQMSAYSKARPLAQRLQALVTQSRLTALPNAQNLLKLFADGQNPLATVNLDTWVDQVTAGPTDLLMAVEWRAEGPCILGTPIWNQLPGESQLDFSWYDKYLHWEEDYDQPRSSYALAKSLNVPVAMVDICRYVNSWNIRVDAYEQQKVNYARKSREITQTKMIRRHVATAQKLFNIASDYLEQHVDQLTPKTALAVLKLSMEMERAGLGLESTCQATVQGVASNNVSVNVDIGSTSASSAGASGTSRVGVSNTTVSGHLETDKQRLIQLVNVMQSVGVLKDVEENLLTANPEDLKVIDATE